MKMNRRLRLCGGLSAALAVLLSFGVPVSGAASPAPTQARTSASPQEKSKSFQVGESLCFGTFNDQPLNWKILKINKENQALLFATDVLPDTWLPFDETANAWGTSSIRSWLNGTKKGDFLSAENFTQDDRQAILQTPISTGIVGNATKDSVFLISKEDYVQYDIGNVPYDIASFWSRTGELHSENVVLLASSHQASGSFNPSEKGGIRPMLWVHLGSLPATEATPVAIPSSDKLISSASGRSYRVYGPFDGSRIGAVTCQLNNEVAARLELAISGQNKTLEGVEFTNCIGFGKTYTNTLAVSNSLLNSEQQFYVFIGSDHIKNLTGKLSFSNR